MHGGEAIFEDQGEGFGDVVGAGGCLGVPEGFEEGGNGGVLERFLFCRRHGYEWPGLQSLRQVLRESLALSQICVALKSQVRFY